MFPRKFSFVPAKISFSLKSFVKSVCWVLISRSDIFYLAGWEYRGFVVGPVTWSASGHVTSGGKTGRDQKFEALAIITSTWNFNFDRGPSIKLERGYGWKDNCGSMCGSGFCADSGGQWLARDRPLTRVTRHYAHISPTWTFSDIFMSYIFWKVEPSSTLVCWPGTMVVSHLCPTWIFSSEASLGHIVLE